MFMNSVLIIVVLILALIIISLESKLSVGMAN